MTRPTLPLIDQLPSFDLPGVDTDRLVALAKDAAYVTVGFGVLAVQKIQVRRHEFTEQAKAQLDTAKQFVTENAAGIDARIQRFEASVDQVVDQFGSRLPEPAHTIVNRAHDAAKAARTQVRELITA